MDNHTHNRHERRATAKLEDFQLAEIEIVPPLRLTAWLDADSARKRLFERWMAAPQCYACFDRYPVPGVWVTTPSRLGRRPVRLIAICGRCSSAGTVAELQSRIAAAFLRNGFFIKSMRRVAQFAEGGAA